MPGLGHAPPTSLSRPLQEYTGVHVASAFTELQALASPENRLDSPTLPSPNQLAGWLRDMDSLRPVVAGAVA